MSELLLAESEVRSLAQRWDTLAPAEREAQRPRLRAWEAARRGAGEPGFPAFAEQREREARELENWWLDGAEPMLSASGRMSDSERTLVRRTAYLTHLHGGDPVRIAASPAAWQISAAPDLGLDRADAADPAKFDAAVHASLQRQRSRRILLQGREGEDEAAFTSRAVSMGAAVQAAAVQQRPAAEAYAEWAKLASALPEWRDAAEQDFFSRWQTQQARIEQRLAPLRDTARSINALILTGATPPSWQTPLSPQTPAQLQTPPAPQSPPSAQSPPASQQQSASPDNSPAPFSIYPPPPPKPAAEQVMDALQTAAPGDRPLLFAMLENEAHRLLAVQREQWMANLERTLRTLRIQSVASDKTSPVPWRPGGYGAAAQAEAREAERRAAADQLGVLHMSMAQQRAPEELPFYLSPQAPVKYPAEQRRRDDLLGTDPGALPDLVDRGITAGWSPAHLAQAVQDWNSITLQRSRETPGADPESYSDARNEQEAQVQETLAQLAVDQMRRTVESVPPGERAAFWRLVQTDKFHDGGAASLPPHWRAAAQQLEAVWDDPRFQLPQGPRGGLAILADDGVNQIGSFHLAPSSAPGGGSEALIVRADGKKFLTRLPPAKDLIPEAESAVRTAEEGVRNIQTLIETQAMFPPPGAGGGLAPMSLPYPGAMPPVYNFGPADLERARAKVALEQSRVDALKAGGMPGLSEALRRRLLADPEFTAGIPDGWVEQFTTRVLAGVGMQFANLADAFVPGENIDPAGQDLLAPGALGSRVRGTAGGFIADAVSSGLESALVMLATRSMTGAAAKSMPAVRAALGSGAKFAPWAPNVAAAAGAGGAEYGAIQRQINDAELAGDRAKAQRLRRSQLLASIFSGVLEAAAEGVFPEHHLVSQSLRGMAGRTLLQRAILAPAQNGLEEMIVASSKNAFIAPWAGTELEDPLEAGLAGVAGGTVNAGAGVFAAGRLYLAHLGSAGINPAPGVPANAQRARDSARVMAGLRAAAPLAEPPGAALPAPGDLSVMIHGLAQAAQTQAAQTQAAQTQAAPPQAAQTQAAQAQAVQTQSAGQTQVSGQAQSAGQNPPPLAVAGPSAAVSAAAVSAASAAYLHPWLRAAGMENVWRLVDSGAPLTSPGDAPAQTTGAASPAPAPGAAGAAISEAGANASAGGVDTSVAAAATAPRASTADVDSSSAAAATAPGASSPAAAASSSAAEPGRASTGPASVLYHPALARALSQDLPGVHWQQALQNLPAHPETAAAVLTLAILGETGSTPQGRAAAQDRLLPWAAALADPHALQLAGIRAADQPAILAEPDPAKRLTLYQDAWQRRDPAAALAAQTQAPAQAAAQAAGMAQAGVSIRRVANENGNPVWSVTAADGTETRHTEFTSARAMLRHRLDEAVPRSSAQGAAVASGERNGPDLERGGVDFPPEDSPDDGKEVIALGLSKHPGHASGGLLERFSRHVDARWYMQWPSYDSLRLGRITFTQFIEEGLAKSRAIKFNIDGMNLHKFANWMNKTSQTRAHYLLAKSKFVTNCELRLILMSRELSRKARFFDQGKEISLADLLARLSHLGMQQN